MNRAETVDALAEKTGLSKKSCKDVYEAMFNVIADTLKKKEEFRVEGFGVFKPVVRKARMGRNLKTGEPIEIPAKFVVTFKTFTALSGNMAAIKVPKGKGKKNT